MLPDATIRDRGIVKRAKEERFRPAGYDLTVGKIISKDGAEVAGDFVVLEPHGGMAEAISAESVEMPKDVLAYATPKTTVSRNGILAMNVGIIDPGYRGLISTTLINLSKREFVLRKGRPFLRLSFHDVRTPPENVKTEWQSEDEYVRNEQDKARSHFSESFLDIPSVVKKVAGEVFEQYRSAAFVWFPILIAMLAVLTFIFNFVAPRYTSPPGAVDVRNACQQLIEERLGPVEQKLATQPPAPAKVPPAAPVPDTKVAPQGSPSPNP